MEFNATFIITAISFIVFVFVMNTILYRPLEKIVEERKQLIDRNYKQAQEANTKAKSLLEDKAQKIAQSKIEAKHFIDERLKEGYNESSEVIRNAKSESIDFIKMKKAEFENNSLKIEQDFGEETGHLANMIKNKILNLEVHHE